MVLDRVIVHIFLFFHIYPLRNSEKVREKSQLKSYRMFVEANKKPEKNLLLVR